MNDDHAPTPTPLPPENMLPGFTETSELLHAEGERAVGLTAVGAYPQGFVFELWLFRPRTGASGRRSHAVDPAVVGIRYADGRSGWAAVPEPPRRPSPMSSPMSSPAPELLVRPVQASLVASGARQQVWVSPLPLEGPVELTLSTPDGRLIAAVELVGADLLRAAARAVEVEPTGPHEPAFDAAGAPSLPPPGSGPEQPAEAEAAIRQAFREAFTAGRDGLALVQDGEVLRGAVQEAGRSWPEVAATLEVGLGGTAFLDELRAAVQYQLSWSGNGGFGPQLGYAVRDRGTWKVARATYCRLLDAAGVQYPPPPPQL